jgi:alkanesulfonate monooxygenase
MSDRSEFLWYIPNDVKTGHRGDAVDDNLYTAPGTFGAAGAGTTWLVGSASEVASSLRKYRDLGIGYFILSDTPYLAEIERQGQMLLPLLRD